MSFYDKLEVTQTSNMLDAIPETAKNKLIKYSKERKSMLLIGWNKEQKKTLVELAHGDNPQDTLLHLDSVNSKDEKEFQNAIHTIAQTV